jgi:hypothetical protein
MNKRSLVSIVDDDESVPPAGTEPSVRACSLRVQWSACSSRSVRRPSSTRSTQRYG